MLQQPLDTMLLVAIFLIAGGVYAFLWRARLRLEFRARLAELTALACRRGWAVPPLFASAAREEQGVRQRVAASIEAELGAGEPLSAALAAAGPRWFAPAFRSAVATAEGTQALPEVLNALAREDLRNLALRSRVSFTIFYPAILFVALLALHGLLGEIRNAWEYVSIRDRIAPNPVFTAVFCLAFLLLGGAVLDGVLRPRGWLPGGRGGAEAHLLRLTGIFVGAGLRTAPALAKAAEATLHWPTSRRARRLSAALDEDDADAGPWSSVGLSPSEALRVAAANGPDRGAVLGAIATRMDHRQERRARRLLRLVYPIAVTLVGLLVLLEFRFVLEVLVQTPGEGEALVNRVRGHTVMEVMVCLGVITILVGAALGGEEAHRRTIVSSFDHLSADLAASGHLEALPLRPAISPGTRPVDLGLPGIEATELVQQIEPGLFEVRLTARDPAGVVLVDLTTRVVRAEGP